jgi:hypothetical protein
MKKGKLLLGVAAVALAVPGRALAEDAPAPAVAVVGVQQAADGGLIYTPDFFTRFAPTDALDMLGQVPGFSIQAASQERGLGEVTGNVVINGQRVSTKSEDIFTQLSHISANKVERIEIVDGSKFNIPGLTGQVANVITKSSGIGGHFLYRTVYRPKYAKPAYIGGEVTVTGSAPRLDWTVAYNHGTGRGAAGGPGGLITDGMGTVTEHRDIVQYFKGDFPRISGSLKWTSPSGTIVNLRANYNWTIIDNSNDENRDLVTGVDRFRDFQDRGRGHGYEISGDIDFKLGPGRLKLIGLDNFSHFSDRSDSIFIYADNSPSTGGRYAAQCDSAEYIGRAEYRWAMLGGNWELDAEAAFNRLNQTAQLYSLDNTGAFVEIPFPGGSGGVTEDRYEVILNDGISLAKGWNLQLSAGGEYSKIAQTGTGGLVRTFWRPKGSATLSWSPQKGLDLSLKLSRTVGQLSFGDFLAKAFLDANNQNASNPELVPTQAWNLDFELKKTLGPWGSTDLKLYARRYQDYIDIIPLAGGIEARGNIPSARLYGANWTSTFNFDPLGWKGAKLDASIVYEKTSLKDPLTGISHQFSFENDVNLNLDFRDDIPHSNWAWGGGYTLQHIQPYYRLAEVGVNHEGPYTYAFIENKNVLGLDVRFQVFNLTNGRAYFHRTVWDGPRDSSPILFIEDQNLSVQPIFQVNVKGKF